MYALVCFCLASAYAGAAVGPVPLALDGALAGPCDLAVLAGATAMKGRVNETITALVASMAAELARDPVVRARLLVIVAACVSVGPRRDHSSGSAPVIASTSSDHAGPTAQQVGVATP